MAKIYKIAIVFIFLGMLPFVAEAATLYFSPSSGSYTVGSTLSINVYVSSADQAMNAASGVIYFPQDKLEVISLSKSGSIFTLWVQEPLFSNSVGTINFEGIVLNPGFIGVSGKIITVNFKVKAAGAALLNFSSGSVLANDGKGTNILASLGNAQFSFGGVTPTVPETTTPSVIAGAPSAPQISSATHPDPDKWYSNNSPEFSWELPSDVTSLELLINKNPISVPTVLYSSPISEKKIEDLEDGVWYFHIRFKNQYGWGGVTHRKVLIDTEEPQLFETKIDNSGDPTNPTPILHFKAIDYISGIEYYEVKIGEKEDIIPVKVAKAVVSNPYEMPLQLPGKHTVIIKAVDAANNETLSALDIIIEPLEMPIITEIPERIETSDSLIIKGTSLYPEGTITVFVKKEGEEPVARDVKTDKEGNWIFVYEKSLDKGIYQVWLEITDSRGAKSKQTEKIAIAVNPSALLKLGKTVIDYLAMTNTLIALVVFLLVIIFYSRYQISRWRKKIKKETKDVEKILRAAFKSLREEVQEQIEYFDSKPGLTKKEKEIRDKLRESLKISEEFISEEIEDIKKELENKK